MSSPRDRNALAAGIAALATAEGRNATRQPGVSLYRISGLERPTSTLYAASLILVGSGEKHATLGDTRFVYNAGHYLVVASPMPMVCRTLATSDDPLLSLMIEIELPVLRALLLELDDRPPPPSDRALRSVFRARLTPEIEDAGVRLLACLTDDRRTRALGRQIVRELLFLALDGADGDSLRALAAGPISQLDHVLRHINQHVAEPMPVPALARLARMSIPTFHQHFKTMTGRSPLQYVKALRLTRARDLLHAGSLVKTVAHAVGYESESQFSREYRRFHGAAPSMIARR